jgi:hypothetical protein
MNNVRPQADEKRLFLRFECFVLGKYRGNGSCGDGTTHQGRKLAAVMDMRNLETDDQPETEAGDADQRVTDNIYHMIPSFRTPG